MKKLMACLLLVGIIFAGCANKNYSGDKAETKTENNSIKQGTNDNVENTGAKKKVYICKVKSIDGEYVVLTYSNDIYKISSEDCSWLNVGDTVDLTFSNDKLQKLDDNNYLVTEGYLSPFKEVIEK